MRTFTLGKTTIVCEFKSTRNGFKHTATLLISGRETGDTVKCCYINRTWECYEYQDVFHKMLNQADRLSKRQKTLFRKKYDGRK